LLEYPPEKEALMKFEELGLAETPLRAVAAQGYSSPAQIQSAAIPSILAGRDLLGCAQTGTGKTAAFALPILHRLDVQPDHAYHSAAAPAAAPRRAAAPRASAAAGARRYRRAW
jgi:ATP-dependent RNA helicase RhlE